MKVTIPTPDGDITVDVNLDNGHVGASITFIRMLRNAFGGHVATSPAPVTTQPTQQQLFEQRELLRQRLEQVKQEKQAVKSNKLQRGVSLAITNRTSRYYSVSRGRNTRAGAETYEYIAAFKHGRTTLQIMEHFHIKHSTASSRCLNLKNDGLIVQQNGRGSAWVVTK